MSREQKNLSVSISARLLNIAQQAGYDYQNLLTRYCFERFLYRLGRSAVRDRFVLKGAMLLQLWSDRPYRATRDLDLSRSGDSSFEAIRSDIRTICAIPVEADAVVFDGDTIEIETIRAADEYAGTRTILSTRCGTARLKLQIDIGQGDSIWPAPQSCSYPTLLELPAPEVLAYPREAVVAEKLEAIVVLGDRNSRIKDFFDLHYLASSFEYDRARLAEAVRRTFARRRTPCPLDAPIGLTKLYWENPTRPAQVRAFARRARLAVPEDPGNDFVDLLAAFLLPVLEDARSGMFKAETWAPGGPWD